jgi:hypothetical protein
MKFILVILFDNFTQLHVGLCLDRVINKWSRLCEYNMAMRF